MSRHAVTAPDHRLDGTCHTAHNRWWSICSCDWVSPRQDDRVAAVAAFNDHAEGAATS